MSSPHSTGITPLAAAIPDPTFASGVLVKGTFSLPWYTVKDGRAIQIDHLVIDPYRHS